MLLYKSIFFSQFTNLQIKFFQIFQNRFEPVKSEFFIIIII